MVHPYVPQQVMGEGEEHGIIKIADFGLARIYQAPLKALCDNGVSNFIRVPISYCVCCCRGIIGRFPKLLLLIGLRLRRCIPPQNISVLCTLLLIYLFLLFSLVFMGACALLSRSAMFILTYDFSGCCNYLVSCSRAVTWG